MNREIKFRVWDKMHGQMFSDIGSSPESLNEQFTSNTDYIFMQSTGLFDKNGKETYEGDIFKGNLTAGLTNWEYLIVFVSGAFMFQNGDKLYHIKPKDFLFLDKIGNKFENPELLNQSKTTK